MWFVREYFWSNFPANLKLHFHGKNTIRHNDRKQNQFFCERTKTKKKISSANFPFKKKRALKFQKTRSFLSLRASGLPIFLALAGRQAIPPLSLPRPRVKISYRRAMRNFSSRMDYAESRTARGQSGGERGREGGGREWRANVARWHTVASAAQQIKDRRWIITSPLPGYRA